MLGEIREANVQTAVTQNVMAVQMTNVDRGGMGSLVVCSVVLVSLAADRVIN